MRFSFFHPSKVLLLILQAVYSVSLQVDYDPVDDAKCSTEYTLFIESNLTLTITLDQPVATIQYTYRGMVKTIQYTDISVEIVQTFDTAGTYPITIATPEGDWNKQIRVITSPIKRVNATISYTYVMPGEVFNGKVLEPENSANYKWYGRKLGIKNPWKFISSGSTVSFQYGEKGTHEFLVTNGSWQSPCRTLWRMNVYVVNPIFYFGQPDIPIVGQEQLITNYIHNASEVSDVIWKYGGHEITSCKGRSRIVKAQIFECRVQLGSFDKQLQVILKPDDTTAQIHSITMSPVTRFNIFPLYVQKGSLTEMRVSQVDGNYGTYQWRGVQRKGGADQDITSWSVYYQFNDEKGTDVLVVEVFNPISYVKKNFLIHVVDINSYYLRNSHSGSLLYTETAVPMGTTITLSINDVTPNTKYNWDFTTTSETSIISPANNLSRIFNLDDSLGLNPDPWYFTFKITATLDWAPGLEPAREFTIYVYKEISSVRTESSIQPVLVVGSQYQFKILWHGSQGECLVRNHTFPRHPNITNTIHSSCIIDIQAPHEPDDDLRLQIRIQNRLNYIDQTYTFKAIQYIECLNISYNEHLARQLTYTFHVTQATLDTTYDWYLIENSTQLIKHHEIGKTANFTVDDTFEVGFYKVLLNAAGPLFRTGILSASYVTKVVASQVYPNAYPDVIIHPNVNSTISFSIGQTVLDASYKWYFYDKLSEIWTEIGVGQNLTFQVSHTLSEGTHYVQIRSEGPWILHGLQTENITFDVCLPSDPLVVPNVNRTLLASSPFYTSVIIDTQCITKHFWSIHCVDNLDPNCDSDGNFSPNMLSGMSVDFENPSLEVPARSLAYGNYVLKNDIRVREISVFNITIRAEVKSADLIPVISGGGSRTVGFIDDVILDAQQTLDPDHQTLLQTTVFRWDLNVTCFLNKDSSSVVGTWSNANREIKAMAGCLHENITYTIEVFVKRRVSDTTIYSTKQTIRVVPGSLIPILIVSPTMSAFKTDRYNSMSENKFSIQSCVKCEEYTWTVKGLTDGRELLLPIRNRSYIIIPERSLDGVQDYIINIEVKGVKGSRGFASITIRPNRLPENGTCRPITPNQGWAMETKFKIECFDWVDRDSIENVFTYLLVLSQDGVLFARSYDVMFDVLLPPGDESNDWKLPFEIWIMDALGGVTVAVKSEVIVKVQTPFNAPQIIQQNVIHRLEASIAKKENVKTLSLVIGSAILLSYGNPKNNISINLVNRLSVHCSEIKPNILQDVRMITTAAFLLRQAIKMPDLELTTRINILDSIKRSISFSDILAQVDMALSDRTHHRLIYLLDDNFDFDTYFTSLQNRESVVNSNYATIQRVYELVIRNLVNNEDRMFRTNSIVADIQKVNIGKDQFLGRNISVGECQFDYKFTSTQPMANEIRECSRHNPYARTGSNSSVASLTFQDESFEEVKITKLPSNESFVLTIPTKPDIKQAQNVFTLKRNELAYIEIRKALSRIWEGDLNTALIVSLNVTRGAHNKGTMYIHRSETIEPQKGNLSTVVSEQGFEDQTNRTILITGSDFINYEQLYIGVHHNSDSSTEIEFNFIITKCHFWNVTSLEWDGTGCQVVNNMTSSDAYYDVTLDDVICSCNHLTSFGGGIRVVPNKLDFTVLREIDVEGNPIALATILVTLALYLILMFMARRKDDQESKEDHVITFIGSEESFYHYEIRIKTGMYPYSGTTCRVGIQIFGTSCVTKTRILKTTQSFQRNSLDIFRISLDQSIGKLHTIGIWHDHSGDATEWYLERVVIKNLVDGEKFFFFCNQWIGPRHDNGNVVHKFHVADKHQLKRFSVIFYDMLGRCLSDLHMWLSLFERPKYTRFNRKQRLSCLFTFIFTWMSVNAMWFNDDQQTYIDSSSYSYQIKGFSLQEIIIGLITVLMVFPLNFLFWLLFRKSRQKEYLTKLLKVWKKPRRVHTDFIDIMDTIQYDSDDPEEEEHHETQSLIRRKKNCLDVHELLEDCLNVEGVGVDTCNFSLSSTNTSSKTPLLLPRTFGGPSAHEEGTEENAYEFFEKWKIEHFGSTQLPMTPSKKSYSKHESEKYSVSCCTLRGENIPKIRRTHSVGGSSVDLLEDARFTNIKERVQSAHYSTIGQEEFTVFHFNKHEQQIQRNEELAKELAIPDIMEYDPVIYWTLPHWCVYIGYISCFLLSTFCIIVVLVYGQQFGRDKALKWLKSLIFGFVEDVFFVYPLLMIFISAVTALFIKPLDLDRIDHLDFKICVSSPAQKILTNVYPPNTDTLPSIAKSSLAQHKRRKRTRDLLLQILLTWLAMVVVVNNDVIFTIQNESYHQQLERFGGEYLSTGTDINLFNYWSWFESTFIPSSYQQDNEKQTWQLAFPPSVHQKRFAPVKCLDTEYQDYARIRSCYEPVTSPLTSSTDEYFLIESISKMPKTGNYRWLLPGLNDTNAPTFLATDTQIVKHSPWISRNTRGLYHRMLYFNTDIQLYAYYESKVIILDGGHKDMESQIIYFNTNIDINIGDFFVLLSLFVILLCSVCLALKRVVSSFHMAQFTRRFWFYHGICWFVVALLTFVKYLEYVSVVHEFNSAQTKTLELLRTVASDYGHTRNLIATLLFVIVIRWIHVLRWSTACCITREVILQTIYPMIGLMMVHLFITLVFAHPFYLLCHELHKDYSTFKDTYATLLLFPWSTPIIDGEREQKPATSLLRFLHLSYACIFALLMFKPLVMSIYLRDVRLKVKAKKDSNLLWRMFQVFLKRVKNKTHPKTNKHVHFKVEEVDNKSDDSASTTTTMDTKPTRLLPPLPFSNETLAEHLHSAIDDLDNILAADQWELEFLNHFEKRFRNDNKKMPLKRRTYTF